MARPYTISLTSMMAHHWAARASFSRQLACSHLCLLSAPMNYTLQMIQRSSSNTIILLLLIITLLSTTAKAQCPSGYNCTSCSDPNCQTCNSNISTCDACNNQYYLDSNSSICTLCPTQCLNCSTPYQCDQCTPGYDTAYDSNGYQYCVFYWWKWFLIIFGSILGIALIVLAIYFIRKKLKQQETHNKQIEYQMKLQRTEPNIG